MCFFIDLGNVYCAKYTYTDIKTYLQWLVLLLTIYYYFIVYG